MELPGALDRAVRVDLEAVDLHHAGVGLAGDKREGAGHPAFEQPSGRTGSNDHTHVGTHRLERVDDLDLTRRMPEAMPGDVKDDCIDV